MSKETYQIKFNDKKIRIKQMLAALTEIAREMDVNQRKLMSELKWTCENGENPPDFNSGKPVFEAIVPSELTDGEGVSNEIIRILPIDDKTIQIAITDASLPPTKCEEIAIQFTQQLYKKATGKYLDRKKILIKKMASLKENVCEYCLKPLESLPYRCRKCGRTFCFDHRRPETHGCHLNIKPKPSGETSSKHESMSASKKQIRPKAVICKLLCG